ncbi:MAG: MerR family transcriptional regulator [Clostridiales bacterium]|jgi:DNA-binding transcriptional MerR regulator|nr:MerR family transcriptional regulator [Clostridiales bacterium]
MLSVKIDHSTAYPVEVIILKIGEFARKHAISINTVRYYINMGLILPEATNKQYRFNEQNMQDVELILQLKQYGFPIGQIHEILSLMRISNLASQDDVLEYIDILENKKGKLHAELNRLQQTIAELGEYIETIRSMHDKLAVRPRHIGVPIEFMPMLCCPHCTGNLGFADASIENGHILGAQLSCQCGYHASIMNGILVTQGRHISELDSPDLDRKFYKDLPASWVSLFQRSYNWIFSRMRQMDLKNKVVMENHINCYFFLYVMLGKIDPDALYIVSDKYPEIVTLYKELIESQNLNLKILFLADSSFKYPLRPNCVDLYIDYCSINEYSIFETQNDLIDVMRPYFKEGADMLGTYFYFDSGSASHRKLMAEYPICFRQNYLLHHFNGLMQRNAFNLIATKNNGYVTDAGSKNRNFTFHVAGDKLHLQSYHYKI